MKKPAKPWAPVPVAVQIQRHKAAQARKHHHPKPAKAKTVKRAGTHHKKRHWTPDSDVALCAARAVAESLRIATGRAVADADVLSWYWATASTPDEGQTILEALSAAGAYAAPCLSRECDCTHILGVDWPQPHAVVEHDGLWWSWGEPYEPWTDQVSETWAVTWLP